jgi:hypothetical protein
MLVDTNTILAQASDKNRLKNEILVQIYWLVYKLKCYKVGNQRFIYNPDV